MTEAHFNRLIKTSNWAAFRADAWQLFSETGKFVDIASGQIFTAPTVFKNRPRVSP